MSRTIHDWEDKLLVGRAGEAVIDEYFKEPGLVIREAEMKWQECGIDRWFIRKGFWLPIEYKTDFRADETDNLFLEIRKNCNGKGKAGWAKTSLAKILYYYVPPRGHIYAIDMSVVQSYPEDFLDYRTAKAYNEGYHSEGILYPLKDRTLFHATYDRAPKFATEEALLEWFERYESEAGHQESGGK